MKNYKKSIYDDVEYKLWTQCCVYPTCVTSEILNNMMDIISHIKNRIDIDVHRRFSR